MIILVNLLKMVLTIKANRKFINLIKAKLETVLLFLMYIE